MRKVVFIISLILLLGPSFLSLAQDKISQDQLKKHISFLASDSLKGRKPGTIESTIAAQYIADEFKQYGLRLPGNNGFQYFEVKTGVKAGENHLKIGNRAYSFGKDFTVLSYSENSVIKAPVVLVGYGFNIQKDSLKWNDYENVDVKGKWVIILRGYPDYDNPSSIFAEFGRDRSKILTARDKGAAGVIFVSSESVDKKDELIPLKIGGGDDKCGLPVVQIKRVLADEIIKKSGKTIELIEKGLNNSKKPLSFDTRKLSEIKTEVNYISVKTQNVVAILDGSDPILKSEFIVVGAHFDHLGFGGHGSGSRKPDTTAIHNGADDNASGVASILEIASLLSAKKADLKRSLVFIAFGAEELGTLGSNYFVKNSLVDIKQIDAMLNLDMVGRLNELTREFIIMGTGTAKEMENILSPYQNSSALKLSFSKEGNGPSDHAIFYAQNIPVLNFYTNAHDQYHTPEDDENLINYKGQEEISNLVAQIIVDIASMPNRLTFQESGSKEKKTSRGGLKVKLDLMPDFASTGNTGLKVNSVTKDGRAYKAGILKGDIITALNGEQVLNIEDYMSRLQKFKPGERITVEVMRGDEKKMFSVDL